jgi:hypothetical protein
MNDSSGLQWGDVVELVGDPEQWGFILQIEGTSALVAWDGSDAQTWVPLETLRDGDPVRRKGEPS